MFSINKDIIW